jgi:hypothetical protein
MKSTTLKRTAPWSAVVCTVALSLIVLAPAGVAAAGNPGAMPPNASPYGKTYGEWAAEWIKWNCAIPTSVNPQLDLTGENAQQNQSGPVWFLAGVGPWGGGTVVRQTTVPAGKALFFPLASIWWLTIYPYDSEGEDPLAWWDANQGWVRDLLQSFNDAATDLSCEIDGVPVAKIEQYRAYSPDFMAYLPDENIFDLMGYPGDVEEQIAGPGVDMGGYYLFLAPLSAGEHTLHFTGTNVAGTQDVTYILDVVPANE